MGAHHAPLPAGDVGGAAVLTDVNTVRPDRRRRALAGRGFGFGGASSALDRPPRIAWPQLGLTPYRETGER